MKTGVTLALMFILLVVLGNSFFILPEGRQAIITQFGEIVGKPITDAGPHFKKPFIQKVHLFEQRILEWDGDPDRIPTRDKKFIFVDSTARWRISDPVQFFKRVRTMKRAIDRLNDIIDAAVRDQVSLYPLIEIVRSTNHITELSATLAKKETAPGEKKETEGEKMTRTAEAQGEELLISISEEVRRPISKGQAKILAEILEKVRAKVNELQLGMEVIDVRLKGLNYDSEDVRRRVYDRMIAERRRIAALYLSEGRGKKAEIEGEMERKLREIRSQAYRQAQIRRGQADAEATRIYAEAYQRDPDFFAFLRTMESYRKTIKSNHALVISTDSPFYAYFKRLSGTTSKRK